MNKEILTKLLRHILGFAGGYFVAKGIEVDAASLDAIAGGLAAVIAIVWSLRAAKPVVASE
jgi:hypothetical protein